MDDPFRNDYDDGCDAAADFAGGEGEVRYGLTAAGVAHVEERRSFRGFGPCAAMERSGQAANAEAGASLSPAGRRSTRRLRVRPAMPLFG